MCSLHTMLSNELIHMKETLPVHFILFYHCIVAVPVLVALVTRYKIHALVWHICYIHGSCSTTYRLTEVAGMCLFGYVVHLLFTGETVHVQKHNWSSENSSAKSSQDKVILNMVINLISFQKLLPQLAEEILSIRNHLDFLSWEVHFHV